MEHEGLYTLVWGPDQWNSLHCITFNYPYNPTKEDKDKYYKYFISLGDVLPCCTCRKHYKYQIENGDTALTYANLESRDTLTLWMYNLHMAVNKGLGFNYEITYEMLRKKYNSYIAKCVFTDEHKKNAFKNMYDVHAPVVRTDILLCFADYVEKRGGDKKAYIENINKYSSLNRESEEWTLRNEKCQEQIKKMRINGFGSIEQSGKFTGLPTLEEIKLMEMGCSMLSKSLMKQAVKKLGCGVKEDVPKTDI